MPMDPAKECFELIGNILINSNPDINYGKMMSAPALVINKKVFAFYYHKKMVFKLGKKFDLNALGIKKFQHLNPFKNKPPLYAWFEISYESSNRWEELALLAYEKMKDELRVQ